MTTMSLKTEEKKPLNILNLSTEELKKEFYKAGIESYRADQIHHWIFAKSVYDFD